MYRLTEYARETFKEFEGKNGLKIFDSSPEGFVLGFGMTKEEGIERGLIEKKEPNVLHDLCKTNAYIPLPWIEKNLSEDQKEDFHKFMIGQAQSEYGVFSVDVIKFLERNGL